jgi:hypothetical protein
MRSVFILLTIAGLSYMAVLIATTQPKIRSMFRRQLSPERLTERLQSDVMQEILRQSGIQMSAKQFNLFRIFFSLLVLVVGYVSMMIQNDLNLTPLFIVFLIWFSTTPQRYTLGSIIFAKLQQRQLNKKNGELMAFLKLYENNKRVQNLRFEHFVKRVSPHFRLLGKELIILSERATDDGLQHALDWFVKQFPGDHPFVGQIRTIILATEEKEGEEVVKYLDQESNTIARISNDLYLSRWSTISTYATVINALPSLGMLALVVILCVYQATLVNITF